MRKGFFVGLLVFISLPAIGQDDPYTCIERHPNGVEVWGCYQGEPYWNIAEYAGDTPLISGGTLYMPSRSKKRMGMGDRIIENAITTTQWQFESRVNRKVEERIFKTMEKIF